MNKTNNIENLITHLKVAIIEKKLAKYSLLNDVAYIDKMSRELIEKKLSTINLSVLESLIKKIGIEEYEIFLELKEVIDKLDMSESLPSSIETPKGREPSKDDAIQFILSGIKELQISSEYEEEFEQQLVDSLIKVLSKILESLYDKEIQRISEKEEYKQLSREVKELSNILTLVEKSNEQELLKEEQDLVYKYIINSTIEDKINLYTDLIKIWIEQTKKSIISQKNEEETIIHNVEQPTSELAEIIDSNQKQQQESIRKQTNVKTEEEWEILFKNTKELINKSTKLSEEQKIILIKILLNGVNMSSEDICVYEDILNECEEIRLESRNIAYLRNDDFEEIVCRTAAIDLVINLIPNLENTSLSEIYKIIDAIIDRYNQYYLSKEELQEIKDLIISTQENFPNLSYITYTDDELITLEELFKEYDGNIEKLKKYDEYNIQKFKTSDDWDSFIENTFKKNIKIKIEELKKILESNSSRELIIKGKIPRLRNELEFWIEKYNEYTIAKKISVPYKQYTIEEIQNIDFVNKNAVIFLNGENGMTLYEEGLNKNGLNKNGTFQLLSEKKAREIIKKVVNGGRQIKDPEYYDFNAFVEKNNSSSQSAGSSKNKPDNHVIIANHELIRLSQKGNPTRVTIINLNKMPDINKKKIGISPENTVAIVIGLHEINFGKHGKSYAYLRTEAEKYEGKIKTIVSIFEDPTTPKEKLLSYIAKSYGLLEKILGEQEPPQQGLEKTDMRGGRG